MGAGAEEVVDPEPAPPAPGGEADPGSPPESPVSVPEPPDDPPAQPSEPPPATEPEPPPPPTEPAEPPPTEPAEPPPTEPVEPSAITVEGCGVIGGYDRIFIFQRDAATGICTDFVLRSPDDGTPPLPDLLLPTGWAVEDMASFACSPDGAVLGGITPTYFTRAGGSVTIAGGNGALPRYVQLNVVLREPAEDAGTPADQMISEQAIETDEVDLTLGCPPRPAPGHSGKSTASTY